MTPYTRCHWTIYLSGSWKTRRSLFHAKDSPLRPEKPSPGERFDTFETLFLDSFLAGDGLVATLKRFFLLQDGEPSKLVRDLAKELRFRPGTELYHGYAPLEPGVLKGVLHVTEYLRHHREPFIVATTPLLVHERVLYGINPRHKLAFVDDNPPEEVREAWDAVLAWVGRAPADYRRS